jgi:O-antigen/teichoic acid export membrane protein
VRTVRAKLASYALANTARVLMLLNDAPLWMFAVAALVDAVLLASALAFTYRRYPTSDRWAFDGARAARLLKESWPFMISGLAALLYMRIDQLMIREMLGEEALGLYSAGVPLSQVWNVIPVTLATALAPVMARKKLEGDGVYLSALMRIFRVFAALSLAVTVATALCAPFLVSMLYGTAYQPASQVLAVHVFSNLFIFLGVAQGLWLINEGHGRLTLIRTALGAVTSVVGNWLLIPRYGIVGAATVSVLAQFVAAVGSNALFAPQILKMQLLAFVPSIPTRKVD